MPNCGSQMVRPRGLAKASVIEEVTTPLMKAQGTGDLELVRLPPGLTVANAMARVQGVAFSSIEGSGRFDARHPAPHAAGVPAERFGHRAGGRG